MALEIKELVVKFNVEDRKVENNSAISSYSQEDIKSIEASIINRCVEKIISILERRDDR